MDLRLVDVLRELWIKIIVVHHSYLYSTVCTFSWNASILKRCHIYYIAKHQRN